MNKKGADILHNAIIFVILNVIFFAALIFFVSRSSAGINIVEQTYAKQIALIIDQAKPGTIIEVDVSELYEQADKNSFDRLGTVKIDNDENKVYIKVTEGKGHSYNFFTSNDVLWGLEKKSGKLHIEIK
jgi:hypothetical protein